MNAPPLSILVVEDEPAIRLSVGDALRAAGHRVLTCRSGPEALDALGVRTGREAGLEPERNPSWEAGRDVEHELDLVISNMNPPGPPGLPENSGLQLFRHIRMRSPRTDVILLTSHGGVADAVAALKEGARDYLLKPFDIEELLLRVSRIAEQRQLREQLFVARAALQGRPEGRSGTVSSLAPPLDPVGPLSVAMKEFERAYLLHTLDTTHGRKAAAAKQLGISRKNLWEKLRSHGINQSVAGDETK